MPLTLVTGPPNAGKTGYAYDAIRRASREGSSSVLLLPSQPDVSRAREALCREIPLGLRVTTFDRHFQATWAAEGDGRRITTPIQRRMLLSGLAETVNVSAPGLVLTAEAVIRLAAMEIGPDWRTKIQPSGVTESLERLLESYARELEERGMLELHEAGFLLASWGRLGADVLVVHRFTDLSRLQETFLVAATKSGAQVLVTLPWVDDFPASSVLTPLVDRLSAIGERVDVEDAGTQADSDLSRIAAGLFADSSPGESTGAVKFVEADGDEGEASAIAAEVLADLSAGTPAENIAVAFRDPIKHLDPLKAALGSHGIAADYDVLVPLGAVAFGRAYLQLLTYVIDDDLTSLIAFIRSPYSGVCDRDSDLLEVQARGSSRAGTERIATLLSKYAPALGREVSKLRRSVHSGLDVEVGAALIRSVRNMLGNAHHLSGVLQAERLSDDARVAGLIQTLVETAATIDGHIAGLPTIRSMLEQHHVAPRSVENAGRVQVTGVDRIRARRFDTVIVGGMEAGEFPAQTQELLDPAAALGRRLLTYGVTPDPELGPGYERLLLYQLVTRPRHRLVLIRRRADSVGTVLAPSAFWEEILDFYRSPVPEIAVGEERENTVVCDAEPSGPREPLREAAIAAASREPRVLNAIRRARPVPAELVDPAVREGLAQRTAFSPSEIEAYLACPLQWFYQRVISPSRLDYEFDASERGRLMHTMLAAGYESLIRDIPEGRVTPENLERCRALVADAGARVLREQPPSKDVEQELDRRVLLRQIDEFVQRDATLLPPRFAPVALESSPGGEGGIDMGDYVLVGRVDRLDSDGARPVIIDYKSGGIPTRAAMLEQGRVQLHLYAEMVRRESGLEPAAALYCSLKKGKVRGLIDCGVFDSSGFVKTDCGDSEQLRDEIEQAMALASSAVAGIREGIIEPKLEARSCTWCDARGYCERLSR